MNARDALIEYAASIRTVTADEAQPAEAGCWCGHAEDRHWSGATSMTFPDGCHECRGWDGAHVYGQELPWLPEGDAAGAQYDGTP